MTLRDEVEETVVAWDAYERTRSGPQVVDYDCRPSRIEAEPVGRLETMRRLQELSHAAIDAGDVHLDRRIGAHLAYLSQLLGERADLNTYVRATQGCPAAGWSPGYVTERGEQARDALDRLGVGWGPDTEKDLEAAEGAVELDDVADRIRVLADELEEPTRAVVGTTAPYKLSIETVDIDDYWAYWLDGSQDTARLRLNLRNARFTEVRLQSLVLHEIMGHALQGASYTHAATTTEVPWVRLLSVHAQQQVLLEGLAQALPLFVQPDDEPLSARVRLVHYLQLVRAELHLAINSGTSIAECADHARKRAPFWSDLLIGDLLSDRGANVLLRTYLWSYPAGLDWFVHLADAADQRTIDAVLQASYQAPLTPDDLTQLWPKGPAIGGPGGSIRF